MTLKQPLSTTIFWASNWRFWARFDFQTGIMCFKKCQLAKKLKTISRKNFLAPCSAAIWLTNTPCYNPPNRSRIFFESIEKKVWFFSNVQKTLISTLVDLLDLVSIFTDFFQRVQKNRSGGQILLRVSWRARLIYEAWISQIKVRWKVPRFF